MTPQVYPRHRGESIGGSANFRRKKTAHSGSTASHTALTNREKRLASEGEARAAGSVQPLGGGGVTGAGWPRIWPS